MNSMPKQVVTGAGAVVALAALAGLYLGVSRSITPVAGEEIGPIAPSAPIAAAKPLAAPAGPTLDEATVRRMAREEAQAVLTARAAPKKPAVSDDDDDDDNSTNAATSSTPTVPLVQAKPATPIPTPQ